MAGQADGDRTDQAVRRVGRAPDHDHHGLAGLGIADVPGHRGQFLGDKALAVLEPPGLAAAQLLGGRGAGQPITTVTVVPPGLNTR